MTPAMRPMPWVLRGFMILSGLLGLMTGLGSLIFLFAAAAGSGPYMVQGATVSRDEFMAFAIPMLLGEAALCGCAVSAAWGLFRRRYWARPLLLGLAVAATLFSVLGGTFVGLPTARLLIATLTGGLAILVLWWILYRRDDVVDWFEALRGE